MLGDVPEGRLMTWPICKVVGLILGFAASRAATVVLNFGAMRVKVSPAWIVYDAPDLDGVGVAGMVVGADLDGTMIEAPI